MGVKEADHLTAAEIIATALPVETAGRLATVPPPVGTAVDPPAAEILRRIQEILHRIQGAVVHPAAPVLLRKGVRVLLREGEAVRIARREEAGAAVHAKDCKKPHWTNRAKALLVL